MKPNAVIMKVSFTTDIDKNLKCLNIRQLINPKNIPTNTETAARIKN